MPTFAERFLMYMKQKIVYCFLIITLVSSCYKVPISGRRQLNLLPESTMISMSLTSYKEFLRKNKVAPVNDVNSAMIKRVGQNIANAVTTFMRQKKQIKRLKNYKWEFNLIDDKTVNAWCMPGGKVVVYTGLLPVTQNETALAVVMGHEIAHAIARHGNERMSQGLVVQAGGIGLQIFMSDKPKETQDLFLQSYGAASGLGMLKYSRSHESEADKMGLVFMALAGYNPQEAVAFWERMSKLGGANVPQILSTHPSDETRIKDIKAYMPTALKYYKKK